MKWSGRIHIAPVFVEYFVTQADVELFNKRQEQYGLPRLNRREAEKEIVAAMIDLTVDQMGDAYGVSKIETTDIDVTETK